MNRWMNEWIDKYMGKCGDGHIYTYIWIDQQRQKDKK